MSLPIHSKTVRDPKAIASRCLRPGAPYVLPPTPQCVKRNARRGRDNHSNRDSLPEPRRAYASGFLPPARGARFPTGDETKEGIQTAGASRVGKRAPRAGGKKPDAYARRDSGSESLFE